MTPADINHALSALSIEVRRRLSPRLGGLPTPSCTVVVERTSSLWPWADCRSRSCSRVSPTPPPRPQPIYGHLPLPSSTPRFVPLRLPPNLAASSANAGLSSKNKSSSSAAAAASSTAALAAGGANPAASDIYFLADPEVDFAKMLAAPPPGLVGGGVRWKAHWLAVEGVMPRVPENVAPDYQAARAGKAGGAGHAGGAGAAASYLVNGAAGGAADAAGKGAKPALSQELQLYFTRLTAALLPSPEARAANPGGTGAGSAAAAAAAGGSGDAAGGAVSSTADLGEAERARLAALASLRGDTGLQGLVVYLVRWFGEKVRPAASP